MALPDFARKNGAIVCLMITRVTPLKRYKFTNTWPKSLEIGTIKAADAGVLTEKLVITHDRLSWSDALMRAYSGALNLAP